MSLHDHTVFQISKMLRNLEGWLDKAVAYAEARSFDPEVLVQARLYPDQYPLVRQIQAACDSAKGTAARLAGVEVPSHPDDETTLAQLRERINKTVAFLETITPEQLEGGESREITLSFLPGQAIKGKDYLAEMALPNFYFHLVTAYAILRHNGVEVGKRDFIGSLRLYEAKA
ncbi:MAG: DUF1993 domain-containing protein [Myxococcales bacterium]|nr:DUF1993 domain-containing protein [Myxococcales bacterium]